MTLNWMHTCDSGTTRLTLKKKNKSARGNTSLSWQSPQNSVWLPDMSGKNSFSLVKISWIFKYILQVREKPRSKYILRSKYIYRLNVFYCFYIQWGWATSSHNISYSPPPTISNTAIHGKKQTLLYSNSICGTTKISKNINRHCISTTAGTWRRPGVDRNFFKAPALTTMLCRPLCVRQKFCICQEWYQQRKRRKEKDKKK